MRSGFIQSARMAASEVYEMPVQGRDVCPAGRLAAARRTPGARSGTAGGGPLEQPVDLPAVDDAVAWHAGEARVGNGRLDVGELRDGVGVAVEGDQAPGLGGAADHRVIEVLSVRV